MSSTCHLFIPRSPVVCYARLIRSTLERRKSHSKCANFSCPLTITMCMSIFILIGSELNTDTAYLSFFYQLNDWYNAVSISTDLGFLQKIVIFMLMYVLILSFSEISSMQFKYMIKCNVLYMSRRQEPSDSEVARGWHWHRLHQRQLHKGTVVIVTPPYLQFLPPPPPQSIISCLSHSHWWERRQKLNRILIRALTSWSDYQVK